MRNVEGGRTRRRTDVPFTLLFGSGNIHVSRTPGPNNSVRGTLGERDEDIRLRGAPLDPILSKPLLVAFGHRDQTS